MKVLPCIPRRPIVQCQVGSSRESMSLANISMVRQWLLNVVPFTENDGETTLEQNTIQLFRSIGRVRGKKYSIMLFGHMLNKNNDVSHIY